MTGRSTLVEHRNRRIHVALPTGYQQARDHYESLVPAIDPVGFSSSANWDEVLAEAKAQAPHGFLRYFRADIVASMAGSAAGWPATEYLMGNHTIAERMYRHDPAVMLHAPLRTLLYVGPSGTTTLAVDQPSLLFASYNNPEITAVGHELDGLLATLFDLLGGDVPPLLTLEGNHS